MLLLTLSRAILKIQIIVIAREERPKQSQHWRTLQKIASLRSQWREQFLEQPSNKWKENLIFLENFCIFIALRTWIHLYFETSCFAYLKINYYFCQKNKWKEEYKMLLSDLTEFNLEARYPEWQKKFYLRCSKQYTDDYFQKTQKLRKWLKKCL